MTKIIQRSFIKWRDSITYRPTDLPLVSVQQVENNIYKIQAMLFVPSSSKDFELQPPMVGQKTTEAGKVDVRCFLITANAETEDTTFALWSFEAVYEIEGDSQKYAYTQIIINYPNKTPETPRGTVTTPDDPDEDSTTVS